MQITKALYKYISKVLFIDSQAEKLHVKSFNSTCLSADLDAFAENTISSTILINQSINITGLGTNPSHPPSQFIWMCSRGQLYKTDLPNLQHHFLRTSFSTNVHYLGVILEQEFTFSEHVGREC